MSANHFLYPLNPKSSQGYFFEDEFGNTYPTSLAGFLDCYLKTKQGKWGVYQSADQIKKGDFIWVHFALPISAIHAVGRAVGPPKIIPNSSTHKELTINWDWELTEKLQKHPIHYSTHKQMVPVSVVRANPKTQSIIENWLANKFPLQPKSGKANSSRVKFRTAEIEVRQGQPEFRLQLLALYDNRCVISGCETRDALQAAHIKSVSAGGTHDLRNGLILRADIHNLFDRGLFTIDERGVVSVNSVIRDKEYRKFHGKKLQTVLQNANLKALAAHQRRHKKSS